MINYKEKYNKYKNKYINKKGGMHVQNFVIFCIEKNNDDALSIYKYHIILDIQLFDLNTFMTFIKIKPTICLFYVCLLPLTNVDIKFIVEYEKILNNKNKECIFQFNFLQDDKCKFTKLLENNEWSQNYLDTPTNMFFFLKEHLEKYQTLNYNNKHIFIEEVYGFTKNDKNNELITHYYKQKIDDFETL